MASRSASLGKYGSAISGAARKAPSERRVFVMPRGPSRRRRVKSSQVVPARRPARIPAAMNIRFWYWKVSPSALVGLRKRMRRSSSARSKASAYHSTSWRGRPERWVTRSRGVISRLASGSISAKSGR